MNPNASRFTYRALALAGALFATACAGGSATPSGDAGESTDDAGPPGSGGGQGSGGDPSGFQPTGGAPAPPGGNHRPELTRIGDREAEVGAALEIVLEGSDPDGDEITFNVRSSLPDGAKFEKEGGRFTWTPEASQEGSLVLLTFEVADTEPLRDQETIQITVVGAGMGGTGAPKLDPIGDQALVAGRPFALQLVASDPNGDALSYALSGAESLMGAALDAEKGLFEWTPDAALAGQSFKVTFAASDGTQEASEQVNLVVRTDDPGGDQDLPPRIQPLEDREVAVGETIDIVVTAEDENPERLTFELVTPPPEGASFDAPAGHLVWTPTDAQVDRAYRLVFRVSDGMYRAIETVTLTVVPGTGGMVGGECVPDPGEPNPNERAPLMAGTPVTQSICGPGDVDSFVLSLQAGESFAIDARFSHSVGDLDLGIFGPMGTDFEVISDSSDDDEEVAGTAPVAGDYEIVVLGYQDATNTAYTLTAQVTAGGEGDCAAPNDPGEGPTGNDDEAHAASLRDHLDAPLRICAGEADFFYVELMAGQTVTLSAIFSHAAGDLDTELTGPEGYRVASGSADDDESHDLDPVPIAGRYVLQVFGYANAANTYTLSLDEAEAAPCMNDRIEANDSRQNAEPFPPEAYNGLTWCGDPDWYKTQTAAGESLVVFISYDAASAPRITAYDADGTELDDTSWEVVDGDGCNAARQGCRKLTVRPAAAGFVHYQVLDGVRGMAYDLRVRVQAGGAAPMCSMQSPSCGEFEVCDYAAGQCVSSYCDEGFACPGDYLCHEYWCVELCQNDLTCGQAGFECKVLDGLELCGLSGGAAVGDPCFDFTECGGSLDCLIDAAVPDGYCSRTCAADGDCEGGACATFANGNYCGSRCAADEDCRTGYVCSTRPGGGGGMVSVCEPAP